MNFVPEIEAHDSLTAFIAVNYIPNHKTNIYHSAFTLLVATTHCCYHALLISLLPSALHGVPVPWGLSGAVVPVPGFSKMGSIWTRCGLLQEVSPLLTGHKLVKMYDNSLGQVRTGPAPTVYSNRLKTSPRMFQK